MLQHIFVYGTLKSDQCRGDRWPLSPVATRIGWTLGALYDVGPYPALLSGEDRVLGEVWSFLPTSLCRVLEVLDRIEVTNQPGLANEYDRCWVDVEMEDATQLTAQAYRFTNRTELTERLRISPWYDWHGSLYAAWPPPAA